MATVSRSAILRIVKNVSRAATSVAVVGADRLAGEALEALLQVAGYQARYLRASILPFEEEHLVSVRLFLLAPDLGSSQRCAIRSHINATPTLSSAHVLELVSASGPTAETGDSVRWPCRLEALAQAIDTALGEA